jgi:hypothetical protein
MLASTLSNSLVKRRGPACVAVLSLCLVVIASLLLPAEQAHAFSPNYNPSNLIDNPTLTDTTTMNAGQIQAFLSSTGSGLAGYTDVEACDSTIAPYYGHCGQTISAAQIISDASQAYGINPRAILATLEKEQSLVTDPTPSASQINCAMGYNSCANYVGFFTQVDNGTWVLRYNYEGAAGHATWLRWSPAANYPCRNASSLYSAGLYPGNTVTFANPGGAAQTITLANAATASLYCYTPYVGPYNVTGYSGSYNFVYYFQLWFGATQVSTPYAWAYENQSVYADAARTQTFSGATTVAPGGKVYATVVARNVGYQTWSQSSLHLGTSEPRDRTSPFYDSTWLATARPAAMLESSVAPGDDATFQFVLTAPATTGSYTEDFNLVADGQAWLSGPDVSFAINVVSPVTAPNTTNTSLSSAGAGQTITQGQYLLSPDAQSVLMLQKDGNLVLYSDFQAVWNSFGNLHIPAAASLRMQSDDNLVLYDANNHALWWSGIGGDPSILCLQTDGNVVLYHTTSSCSSGTQAQWSTGTIHTPNHLSYVDTTLGSSGGSLYVGQQLQTADRRYRLTLQSDGNLVLYSSNNNHVLWSSGTYGQPSAYLSMQGDGNLVIYDANGHALWNTKTWGHGGTQLTIQQDGNLVIYDNNGHASWSSGTFNQY